MMINEESHNELSLRLFVDSNFIGDRSYAARFLRRLHAEQCIILQRSDTLEEELANAPEQKRAALQGEARGYPEAFGQDDESVEELRRIVKPGVTNWNRTRQQHVRDVKHLHTATRYAADAFVTSDRALLAKAGELKPDTEVWSPRKAAEVAIGRIRSNRRITEAEG